VVAVALDTLRLNLGCGDYSLDGFVNVDAMAFRGVDAVISVPPLPWPDASVSEIYAGHFLEHLSFADGGELLRECFRVMTSGASIGVVVPDFHEIARRYVLEADAPFEWGDGRHDMTDLDELCHYLLFSTVQQSHHLWAYDLTTLGRALERVGFALTREIDRFSDPRLSTPRWYQCGLNASKP
jgi:predicted SAM-dependent methyltransferase